MPDFLERVFKALNQSKVPYFVTGAEAVSVYGRLRTTRDCDVIAKDASVSLVESLRKNGFSVRKLVKGHNSILDTKSSNYIDLVIDPDRNFERCRIVKFKNIRVRFTTPEDLILKKLEFSGDERSGTDIDDVISVMFKQRKKLDHAYLVSEAKKRGTYELLQDIIRKMETDSK